MPSQPVFRFAPSPNGRLHLGHAYSALFTWSAACALGGTCLLRIEDIDLERSRPEFVAGIFEDLHWLGLNWPEPVMHQSRRLAAYRAAAGRLRDLCLLYPCFCTRSEIAAAAGVDPARDPDGAPLYPGSCRDLDPEVAAGRLAEGHPAQWRLDMAEATDRAGLVTYTAAMPLAGDRPQVRYAAPARWGDVVLVRKDTPTSYHLSVVVDDAAQGVTHVTRGRDLEAATDIHALLQMILGLPSPIYTFHRLILDGGGEKLAKSRGSEALADLRAAGWSAADVRRHLGFG